MLTFIRRPKKNVLEPWSSSNLSIPRHLAASGVESPSHDENKSSKQVRKGSQQGRSVRQKVQGAAGHRDITQEKEVQFSSSELQSHVRRATKRWCLDERLLRNPAGHTIDQGRTSRVQRGAGVRMQGLKTNLAGHMINQMYSRGCSYHAAGENHPCQSPSHRKRP